MQKRRRPLERGPLAVRRQIGRRRIRVAPLGAIEFADFAQVDLRETNLHLLVLLVVELAVAQLAFDGEVRALFQSAGERRKIAPRDHPVPLGAVHVLARFLVLPRRLRGERQNGVFVAALGGFHFGVFPQKSN
jgi:hypothetical protein